MSTTTSDTPVPPPARTYPPKRQKIPPFARYQGTSAWKKFRRRVHAYARFKEAAAKATP